MAVQLGLGSGYFRLSSFIHDAILIDHAHFGKLDTAQWRQYIYRRIGADSEHILTDEEPLLDIRKTVTVIEDILIEAGTALPQPVRRVAQIAVIRNPLVGRNDENLDELIHDGEDLGRFLSQRALDSIDRSRLGSVGKAAIIGNGGEPEHGQAILHPKFAAAVRETLGASGATILSDKLIADPGSPIKVHLQPLGAASGEKQGSVMEIRVPGSPRPDEILVALVVSGTSGTRAG